MPPARKVDSVAITGLERWWGFTANSFSENPVSCHAYHSKTVNPVTQGKTYGCKAVNPIPTLWPGFPEAVAFDPKGIGCGQAVSCNVCWTWSKWWWDPSGWLCFTLENHTIYIYILICIYILWMADRISFYSKRIWLKLVVPNVKVLTQLSTFHVHFLLLLSSDNFVSYKSVHIYNYIYNIGCTSCHPMDVHPLVWGSNRDCKSTWIWPANCLCHCCRL